MKTPLVSIILPTYNRAEWLPRSVGAILKQIHTDWELIVWDDGSQDDTQQLIALFVSKDSRISYYCAENHGKAYSLNQALQKASGKYLAFLDDDDIWYPEKLFLQLEIMQKYPEIDLLFANFNNINLETCQTGIYFEQVSPVLGKLGTKEVSPGVFFITSGMPESLLCTNFILPSSTIIKKKCYEKIGNFNDQLRNTEDIEYWWRMSLAKYQFAYIDSVLLDRNKPVNSLSSNNAITYLDLIKALNSCSEKALLSNYKDLSREFNHAYQRAWQSLIRIYAFSGERAKAISAYKNSTKYGFSWRAFYLLIGALLGQKLLKILQKAMR